MRNLKSIAFGVGFTVLVTLLSSVSVEAGQAGQAVVAPRPASQTPVQSPRLRGVIKDPSGAVMSGVDVSAIQAGKVVKAVKTDAEGEFSLDLAAGQYQFAVTAPDFKPDVRLVRVAANTPALVVTLSVEGITSIVNVTENVDQPVVDASLSLDATTLTGEKIDALPDDEESLLAYLQSLAGGEGNAQLIIDGFEGGRLPTRDQIAQIIIEPNSFNANGTGPRITIISKQPGPTRWAGNLSFQYKNSALNAATPGSINKPQTHRSVVSLGYNGPVIKGKLGMNFNVSKEQSESSSSSIKAVTPAGPVNATVVSPSTYDYVNISQNWYLTTKHTLFDSFSFNRNRSPNGGIGGFTLPERGSNSSSQGWNAQVSDNLTISSKMTNTFQFRVNHSNSGTNPLTIGIAINVLDAFNGGGAQNLSSSRNSNYNINETLRWTPNAKWNLQFAINGNHQSNYNVTVNNYLGTYTFSSLEDYEAGNALTFTQTSGNPAASISQTDGNASIQATYRIKSTMSLNMGAQYTIQTHLKDYNNIGPTMQYQAQIKKNSIISVGARLSYPNTGFSIGSYEQLLRGNGTTKQFNTVISNPSYPDPTPSLLEASTIGVNSSFQTQVKDLVSPYTINMQLALNQTLKKGWRISPSFNINRGVHQLRNRNINAPYPGTPLDPFITQEEIDVLRPYFPIVSRLNQYEPTGNSISKNLNLTVQFPSTKKYLKTQISGLFQYGLTWAADDNQVQNPYDIKSDWARNDQRQRFQGQFSVRPPWIGSFNFNFNGNTGRSYSITSGKDDNFDQNINDRPAGVPRNSLRGPSVYVVNLNYNSPVLSFHKKKPAPAAAAGPATAAAANNAALDSLIQSAMAAGLPAAAIQQLLSQPGLVAGLSTSSTPTKQPTLLHPQTTLNVSVNNLLNNSRMNGYSGVITSPLFGQPTSYQPGRDIRFTLNSRF
jgi:hypothetical protein